MPPSARDARAALIAELARGVDAELAPAGFARSPRATTYQRARGDGRQRIELFATRPNRAPPDVAAWVQVWVSVELPAIAPVAVAMMGGRARVLGDAPARIVRMPAGFTTPSRAGETACVRHPDDWPALARDLVATCRDRVVPFLDEHADAAGFARSWARGDDRLQFLEDVWVIKLAAALVVAGEREPARRLLAEQLTSAAQRRRFAAAFAWFEAGDRDLSR